MKSIKPLLIIWMMLILVSLHWATPVPALAQDDPTPTCHGLVWVDGWIRPADQTLGNTAIYGTLINPGPDDIVFTRAQSTIAQTLEFHQSMMNEQGVMQMRPLEGGLLIPAHGATVLQPGGLHIMAIGLTETLAEGQTAPISLGFEDETGEITWDFILTVGQPSDKAEETTAKDSDDSSETDHAHLLMAGDVENCAPIGFWGGWTRVALEGGTVGVYGHLLNLSETDDVLMEVTTEAADVVEIHESFEENGVMHMRPVSDEFAVVQHHAHTFKPGGLHLMVIGLHHPLMDGDTVAFVFHFAEAGAIPVQIRVHADVPTEIPMPSGTEMHEMGTDHQPHAQSHN